MKLIIVGIGALVVIVMLAIGIVASADTDNDPF